MQHVEVLSLRRFPPDYFLQRFTSEPMSFQPGQFVMVKPSGSLDPFLPRAYSILRVCRPNGTKTTNRYAVEILYKIMGRGSTALSRLRPGDRVDLLGPLGNGYRVPPGLTTALLVAGGIGVPPVVALAERLAGSGLRVQGSAKRDVGRPKIVAFVGGKTSHDVLCVTDLRKAGAKVQTATEDGSVGHRGLITDLLESFLRSSDNGERLSVFACGPHPMLHAVAQIAERFQVPCQLSLEADMACGFGACMGCVIPVKSRESRVESLGQTMNREPSTMNHFRYKLCCTDGPAFDAREIAW